MNPFEQLTPWKDMASQLADANKISHSEFYHFGSTQIAYLKIEQVDEKGMLFQIFSACGKNVYESDDMNAALDWILKHDLIPVPVH